MFGRRPTWLILLGRRAPDGDQGSSGLELIASTVSAPSSGDGREGDSWLHHGGAGSTLADLYPGKGSTGWVATPISLAGFTGADGLSFIASTDAPSSADGNEDDSWLHYASDGSVLSLYPDKGSTGWPASPIDMLGADGQSIINSSDAPSSADGNTGDSYIETYSGSTFANLWGPKVSTGWPAAAAIDLKGPAGSGLANVVDDATPELGGDLDVNGNDIVTSSGASLEILPSSNGRSIVKNLTTTGDIDGDRHSYKDLTPAMNNLGDIGAATATLDFAEYNDFRVHFTGNGEIAFSNTMSTALTDQVLFATLTIESGGEHTITWPADLVWSPSSDPPTLASSNNETVIGLRQPGGSSIMRAWPIASEVFL